MEKSDEMLMCELQRDNLSAFDILVKRWEKPLLNYCYQMVNDPELAEDLRQEVFLRIYRSAKTFRGMSQFSTWLYRIATNLCLDTFTKKGYQAEILIGDSLTSEFGGSDDKLTNPSATPETVAVKREMESRVHAALADLPEELRMVVMLRHYHGMKFQEIAESLGCPITTAQSRLAAGTERLRQIVLKQEETVSVQRFTQKGGVYVRL